MSEPLPDLQQTRDELARWAREVQETAAAVRAEIGRIREREQDDRT